MRVKSCIASDGGGHIIQLSDEYGCVLRPKMISRFLKARGADDRASVITYAFFHAFKFPDALSVHIKCKVEICRHGCLDHCQLQPGAPPSTAVDVEGELSHHVSPLERKDEEKRTAQDDKRPLADPEAAEPEDYDDIIQQGEGGASIDGNFPGVKMSLVTSPQGHHFHPDDEAMDGVKSEDVDVAAPPHKVVYLLHLTYDTRV